MEGYTDLPSASSEFYTAARRFPSRNFFVIRSAPPLSFSSPAWRADQSALFFLIFPRVCVCVLVSATHSLIRNILGHGWDVAVMIVLR